MNELERIWSKPTYLPYVQPELTDEAIEQAEELIGFPLPKAYIELLKTQNGGYIRYTVKDTLHEKIFGIGPNFPSITDFHDSDDKALKKLVDRNCFPFDRVGNNEFLCFYYEKPTKEPKIVYLEPKIGGMRFTVAKDFESYYKKLVMDTSRIWVIQSDLKLIDFIAQLKEVKKLQEIEEIDINTHGYPTFKGSINDYNFWIQPNEVPNGVKGSLPQNSNSIAEIGYQYPEIPQSAFLLSCVNTNLANKVIKEIKNISAEVSPLKQHVNRKFII